MAYTRITVDPEMMGGVPCVGGMRMPVATIVGMIADGMSRDDILKDFTELELEDIDEALRYAADTVRERAIPL